ncbi:MATE family efflux transporter [Desulforhopalus singaporensis]|uniref:Uncharacterized protein n=1 Tax=Desulforhopalus singaporensis TaxID=91360 RepID=A0A1H0RIK7_9BACT|nr:hypothetical protein [Desulforhopalus singaporensis]SDP29240.1 hypothetical protein SAMN05660330_02310 [Desulforhopalus singaporensis]
MDSLMVLVVVASAIWVYFDAKSIGAERGLSNGFLNMGPIGWAMCVAILWIICFPLYLFKRSDIKALASGDRIPDHNTTKPSAINTAAKAVGIGWSLFCFAGAAFGIAEISKVADTLGNSDFEMAGATIGAGIGLGVWIIAWIVIAGPATIVFLFTRKQQIVTMVQEKHQTTKKPNTKHCPFCAETILKEAIFCRFCKQSLTNDESAKDRNSERTATNKQTDWLNKGKRLLQENRNNEAIAALSQHIETNQTDSTAIYLRAIGYSRMKDKKNMTIDLKESARLGNVKAKQALKKI